MIKILVLLICCTGIDESSVSIDQEFAFQEDFNEHEGANELSISIEHKDDSDCTNFTFIIFFADGEDNPWFRIILTYSGTSFLNIPAKNSLTFFAVSDTIRLSSCDNGQSRHRLDYDGESLVEEELGYDISDDQRKTISGFDSSTVIVVTGTRQNFQINLKPEDWCKIRWFLGEIAESCRKQAGSVH